MNLALIFVLTGTLPRAAAADSFGGYSFYYGDPHAHTGISHDGYSSDIGIGCPGSSECGAFADVFEITVADGLDWVVLSDHVNGDDRYAATPSEFLSLIQKDLHHDPPGGDLLVIPGAEVWFALNDQPLGHKNLLMFGDPSAIEAVTLVDVVPPEAPLTDCSQIDAWMDGFVATFGDALLIPHHTMVVDPMPTDWSCHSEYEVGVEVYSAWGNSLGWDLGYDEPDTVEPTGSVHAALDLNSNALQMGFLAGTDGHSTQPGLLCSEEATFAHVATGGLTMAVIPEGTAFDAAALHRAIVEHRTLATTGPRVPINVTFSDALGTEWGLGEAITLPSGVGLDVSLSMDVGAAPAVTAVWLITPDGHVALSPSSSGTFGASIPADAVPAWGYVAVQFDSRVLIGLCEDGNGNDEEWVWTSPSWVTVSDGVDPDTATDTADTGRSPGRCSCSNRQGGVAMWGMGWVLAAGMVRRRGSGRGPGAPSPRAAAPSVWFVGPL